MKTYDEKIEKLITAIRDEAKLHGGLFVLMCSKKTGRSTKLIDGLTSAEVVGILEIEKIKFIASIEKYVLDTAHQE